MCAGDCPLFSTRSESPVKPIPVTRSETMAGWLDVVHPNGRTRGEPLDIRRAALLVLDMQAYFLEPESHAFVPGGPALVPVIRELMDSMRRQHRPVIATQHIDSPSQDAPMRRWWIGAIEAGDPASMVIEEIAQASDRIVEKTCYDAFRGTDLATQLESSGVENLILCGVQTHLCVDTTVRSAFCGGYQPWLVVDGTAARTDELHLASLRTLSHGMARMITSAELREIVA